MCISYDLNRPICPSDQQNTRKKYQETSQKCGKNDYQFDIESNNRKIQNSKKKKQKNLALPQKLSVVLMCGSVKHHHQPISVPNARAQSSIMDYA
jgi:hypothetical protein